jgi:MFS family permease
MKPDSETMHRSITSRDILGRWMGAMFVGEVIGLATATVFVRGVDLIGPLSGAGEVLSSLAASALAGALAGACLGVTQWLVLRRFFGDLSERAWVAASALGGALTSILGMLAAAQGPYDASSLWAVASGVLVVGIAVGAIVGGAQAWALRRHPQVAMRWLAANAAGWAIGSLVAYAGVISTLLGSWAGMTAWAAVTMALSVLAIAMAPVVATGLVLRSCPAVGDQGPRSRSS